MLFYALKLNYVTKIQDIVTIIKEVLKEMVNNHMP